MSRLIDADAITSSNELATKIVTYNLTPYLKVDDLIEFVDGLPTIEAVEVVHSEWEICERKMVFDTLGNPATYGRCKNCGFSWSDKYHIEHCFKHCPECGADMRGKKEIRFS